MSDETVVDHRGMRIEGLGPEPFGQRQGERQAASIAQHTDSCTGNQASHELDGIGVERRENDMVERLEASYRGDDVFGQSFYALVGFEFDIKSHPARQGLEGLFESRHLDPFERRAEPRSSVELGDGGEIGCVDAAFAVGSAIKSIVVKDYRYIVTGQLDIELNGVGTEVESLDEREFGVLRCDPRRPTVADSQYFPAHASQGIRQAGLV